MKIRTDQIGGVIFNSQGFDETIEETLKRIRVAPPEAAYMFAFVNAHSVELAHRNNRFGKSISASDFVAADDVGITLASRMLGRGQSFDET